MPKLSLAIRALASVSEAEPLLEVKSPIAVAYLNKLEVLYTISAPFFSVSFFTLIQIKKSTNLSV